VILAVVAAVAFLWGIYETVMFDFTRNILRIGRRIAKGLSVSLIAPIALVGWWTSMYIASCLCRDEIIEVIKHVRSVNPASASWDGSVAKPALGLIEKMKLLSDGWSGGLVSAAGGCWIVALSFFAHAINTPLKERQDDAYGDPPGTRALTNAARVACISLCPFILAIDIADTSTWCDNLMEELNDARAFHGPESHLKIQWLETTLRQLVRSIFCT
jgi:hypothetical protein